MLLDFPTSPRKKKTKKNHPIPETHGIPSNSNRNPRHKLKALMLPAKRHCPTGSTISMPSSIRSPVSGRFSEKKKKLKIYPHQKNPVGVGRLGWGGWCFLFFVFRGLLGFGFFLFFLCFLGWFRKKKDGGNHNWNPEMILF